LRSPIHQRPEDLVGGQAGDEGYVDCRVTGPGVTEVDSKTVRSCAHQTEDENITIGCRIVMNPVAAVQGGTGMIRFVTTGSAIQPVGPRSTVEEIEAIAAKDQVGHRPAC